LILFHFHWENGSIINSFHTIAPSSPKPSGCTPTHSELFKGIKGMAWSTMVWKIWPSIGNPLWLSCGCDPQLSHQGSTWVTYHVNPLSKCYYDFSRLLRWVGLRRWRFMWVCIHYWLSRLVVLNAQVCFQVRKSFWPHQIVMGRNPNVSSHSGGGTFAFSCNDPIICPIKAHSLLSKYVIQTLGMGDSTNSWVLQS
jgi:hypothetical protein